MNSIRRGEFWSIAIWLGVIALLLRLSYFLLALQSLGIDKLLGYSPDTSKYLAIADYLLHGQNEVGKAFAFWVAPGYGLIIAGVQSVFGADPVFHYLTNILFGTLAPIVIFLLARELTESFWVALSAGLISALSPTSLVLSSNVLSDQPFYVVFTCALLCLTLGMKTTRHRWFIAAAILTSMAAFIRPIGQVWPFFFLLIAVFLSPKDRLFAGRSLLRPELIKRLILAFGIALMPIMGWAARNAVIEGAFVFGGNGPVAARWYVSMRAIAENDTDLHIFDLGKKWSEEDIEFYGTNNPATIARYHRFKDEFLRIARAHPDWTIKAYLANVHENMISGNHIAPRQVPLLAPLWEAFITATQNWLSYVIMSAALLGLVIMAGSKRYYGAIILGLVLLYFTLIIGFSRWQGSRLHYPAEIAWSILVPYAVIQLIDWAKHGMFVAWKKSTPHVSGYLGQRSGTES